MTPGIFDRLHKHRRATEAQMTNQQRASLVTYAKFLIAHAPQIHYTQIRPMPTRSLSVEGAIARFHQGGTISMDCSEAVTLIYRWSRCHDPNGLNYDGAGNTHVMWAHLNHRYTNPADAHPGALVVYGFEGDEHVGMVIERNGDNPILFSHGSEIGPLRIDLASESAAHRGQARTFLDVSGL